MKQLVKRLIKSNHFLYVRVTRTLLKIRKLKSKYGGGNIVENHGCASIIKDFIGSGNKVVIGKDTIMDHTRIRFRGNNNKIIFGEGCHVGVHSSFWMEGNNITVTIGDKTTFTHTVHFCVQEDGMSVTVGEGCMFSNHITVRTSDGHPIYDEGGTRINMPQPVSIGNNVWIAPDTKIMKGAQIGDGAIIGSDSMVGSKPIPANSLAVGHPARVVKENIHWTREQLFPQ
jgi:acetyltransferase-like isoleucine patch superfamily enzyme